jgi:tetratricopeptide (TPR) repeat protein
MSSAPLAALEQAIALEPENPLRYRALAAQLRAGGDEAEAMAAELAATALEARSPLALFNIATACFQAGRRAQAKRWYELTLRLDPAMVEAHRNLAAILEQEGLLAEAKRHRDEAYGRQSLFVEPAVSPTLSVLILAASGYGNVPIDELLPQATTTRIKWFVEYARVEDGGRLPPFDLVFNAAGDPDMAGPLPPAVTEALARAGKPLLNPAEAVARTQRDRLPLLLAGIADVEVPPVIRVSGTQLGDKALTARLTFPLIFRPAGAHGGRGVRLLETPAQLASADPGEAEACYLTRYRDCRSPDRYFRT